jgi:hypothetical protein
MLILSSFGTWSRNIPRLFIVSLFTFEMGVLSRERERENKAFEMVVKMYPFLLLYFISSLICHGFFLCFIVRTTGIFL